MNNYHNDINIKFEHTPVTNKTAFNLNHVGAHAGDAIAVTTLSHTDANTIYVNGSSGNDSNAGTAAAPKLTILASINATTATKIYVLVMNSQHFSEDLSTAVTTFLTGLFANTAITATLSTRVLGYTPADANSIYFGATSGTGGGVGTAADPSNTIALAVGLTDGTHQNIVEVDGDTYTEPAIEMTGNFLGMYAADGVKPTFKPTVSSAASDYTATTAVKTDTFAGITIDSHQTILLNNGNWLVCYEDDNDSGKGKFVIYDEDGVIVKSATTFEDGSTDYITVSLLNNGNWVCCYVDNGDSFQGKFVIYDEDGVVVVGPTVFETGTTTDTSVALLNNTNWVCCYTDSDDSFQGKFVIYTAAGVNVVVPTVFDSGDALRSSVALLNNTNWVCCYQEPTLTKGKFVIYDEDGVQVVAPTDFYNGTVENPSVALLNNTNWVCCFNGTVATDGLFTIHDEDGVNVTGPTVFDSQDALKNNVTVLDNGDWINTYSANGDSDKGKLVIYDEDGSNVKAVTTFDSSTTTVSSGVVLNNGNFVLTYIDGGATNTGTFIIYYLYSWTGLKVSAGSNINGFVLDGNDSNQLTKMVEPNGAKPDIKWCDIKNTTNPSTTLLNGYAIKGDNETDVYNSKINDNDAGLYLTANVDDAIIQDNEFYRNTVAAAIHIDGAAAVSGDITIKHNDLFENESAIRLENNHGTNEILKNNIIHNNDNYAVEADTAASISYSIRTDPLSGCTDGSSVILANPLYINEGAVTPSAIDLNIKTKVEGYPSDSPAKDLADDTRNAGSHDVRYIGAATSWTSITVAKPRRGTIDVWYEPVGGQKSVGQDGTVEYSKKGQTENVKIKWVGELKANFDLIRAMWASTESEVRIYFQPSTTPAAYNTYTMTRKTLNASVPLYELSETGVAGHEIEFARKFEEA